MNMKLTPSDGFFDDVVTYLGATAALALAGSLQSAGEAAPIAEEDGLVIRGRPEVSGLELEFRPLQVLGPIFAGSWPAEVDLEMRPFNGEIPPSFSKIQGTKRFHSVNIQSAFVHYFESNRQKVESGFGADPYSWPPEWNFARVVRNAFAHGGEIDFRNKKAKPVSWNSLTYGPSDNGRSIIYVDVTPVELILLMSDMDASI